MCFSLTVFASVFSRGISKQTLRFRVFTLALCKATFIQPVNCAQTMKRLGWISSTFEIVPGSCALVGF